MTATVHKLHNGLMLNGEVDEEIVKSLQEFLDLAKAGRLRNVAIAAIDHDLCSHTVYVHKGRSTVTLAGAIGILNRRLEREDDD